MQSNLQIERKLKIFLSYSRKDLAFAELVVAALTARGFDVKIDTQHLPKLEDWERALLGLIREADALVFIVSSNSATSKVCAWEIEQAQRLNKRLAPIVLERVPADAVPNAISRLNYIFFDKHDLFEPAAAELAVALEANWEWVKEHTRLGEAARRWEESGRAVWRLLGKQDLADAQSWAASRPSRAPEPTALQLTYFQHSRVRATRVQTMTLAGAFAVAALGLGLAGVAFVQREIAQTNETRANQNAELARSNERNAILERDTALRTQSRYLADVARQHVEKHDHGTALALLLEAMPSTSAHSARPIVNELVPQLFDVVQHLREKAVVELEQNDGESSGQNKIVVNDRRDMVAVFGVDLGVQFGKFAEGLELCSLGPASQGAISVAISSDGASIASAHDDGTLKIWTTRQDPEHAQFPVRVLRTSHPVEVGTPVPIAFSPDGTRLVAGNREGGFDIFDVGEAKLARRSEGQGAQINAIAYVSNADILTASGDGAARLWKSEIDDPEPRVILQDRGNLAAPMWYDSTFSISHDRRRVLLCGYGSNFTLLDTATGATLWRHEAPADRTNNCFLSPDGHYAVVEYVIIAENATVTRLFDIDQNAEITSSDWSNRGQGDLVAFSADSKRLAVTRGGGVRSAIVYIFDIATAAMVDTVGFHDTAIRYLVFDPTGSAVLSHAADGTVRIWDTHTKHEFPSLFYFEGWIAPATVSRDGRTSVVSQGPDKPPAVRDGITGALRFEITGASPFSPVSVTSDGAALAAENESDRRSGHYSIWGNSPGRRIASNGKASQIAKNGTRTVAALADKLQISDGVTGAVAFELQGSSDEVGALALSDDARFLAASYFSGSIEIWDLETRTKVSLALTSRHIGSSEKMAFSADNRTLFAGSGSQVTSYTVATGAASMSYSALDCRPRTRTDIEGECAGWATLDASADGRWLLVSMRDDNICRIWEVATGKQVATLTGHNGAAVFSQDSKEILTVGPRGVVRHWPIFDSYDALLAHAHTIAPRNLTSLQRKAVFLD